MAHVNIWFQSMAQSCQEKWNKNAKIRDNCELNLWNYSEQTQHGKLHMLLIIPSINANAQDQIIPTIQINNSEINSYLAFNQIQIYFFNSLYIKLSTTMNFIHKCKHFYTNTLFQRSQPHLPWVFNSCILQTSTARSLQRSPSCSFLRIQLCAWAVGRLYSKRKYLSAAFNSSSH